ncbi:MAG: FAD-binding oxidoreductase [Gammaproteobacteria bacterium]|nr:FAD-binding oxidoreductase [Gammaproteobacteria bacterium]
MDKVVAELRGALGEKQVLTGDAVHSRGAGIWRSDTIQAKALLRPRSTEQVRQALKICNAHGQSVIAHGGLTGLVESAITAQDDIALSLEAMDKIEEINTVDRTMLVDSGVVLQRIQEAADDAGLLFPLDLGGRGSCTIGGNISTNAGGNRVVRYGMVRDMVLGLEAVLADGTLVSSLSGMIKNNAGYDLKQMFIGSEGSLGVITRAVLRLREKPKSEVTAFVATDEFEKLQQLLKRMDSGLSGRLTAFEVMWNNFYRIVTTAPAKQTPPLAQDYPYYVLIELLGGEQEGDQALMEALLADCLDDGVIVDAVLASSGAQRQELWAMRDDVEQVQRLGAGCTFDVSMRVSHMQAYVDEVNARMGKSFGDYHLITFGHMGDGNLHFYAAVGSYSPEIRHRIEAAVYEPLAAIGGSVSAEHGVGLEKKPWLGICRSPDEIALMQRLKRALDPKGILNPGKIIDVEDIEHDKGKLLSD